jgi:hypothetical protein
MCAICSLQEIMQIEIELSDLHSRALAQVLLRPDACLNLMLKLCDLGIPVSSAVSHAIGDLHG